MRYQKAKVSQKYHILRTLKALDNNTSLAMIFTVYYVVRPVTITTTE